MSQVLLSLALLSQVGYKDTEAWREYLSTGKFTRLRTFNLTTNSYLAVFIGPTVSKEHFQVNIMEYRCRGDKEERVVLGYRRWQGTGTNLRADAERVVLDCHFIALLEKATDDKDERYVKPIPEDWNATLSIEQFDKVSFEEKLGLELWFESPKVKEIFYWKEGEKNKKWFETKRIASE